MFTLPAPWLTAAQLRRELNVRGEVWAHKHDLLFDVSPGASPSVVFGRDEQGRHGNFDPAAYARICATPEWARRLEKAHTASLRSRARKDWSWRELDAAVSSDALLMNVFCHPGVYDGQRLSAEVAGLLGVGRETTPEFGVCPGVPLKTSTAKRRRKGAAEPVDRTEIDLVLGELLLEAKLTESDFQTAPAALVERYRDLDEVFEVGRLPVKRVVPPPLAPNVDPNDATVNLPRREVRERIAGYQLIRNMLAAYAAGASFCVLLDARRTDLIETWYAVVSAVHAPEFRWRLKLLTWQELAAALPDELQGFLEVKYGIA